MVIVDVTLQFCTYWFKIESEVFQKDHFNAYLGHSYPLRKGVPFVQFSSFTSSYLEWKKLKKVVMSNLAKCGGQSLGSCCCNLQLCTQWFQIEGEVFKQVFVSAFSKVIITLYAKGLFRVVSPLTLILGIRCTHKFGLNTCKTYTLKLM